MLESSDGNFKSTMITMLRDLTDKVDSVQEQQKGNISKNTKILRRNENEMLGIKIIVTETKSAFDGFLCSLDMAEERLSPLEDMPQEAHKMERQRKIVWQKWVPKECRTCQGNTREDIKVEKKHSK